MAAVVSRVGAAVLGLLIAGTFTAVSGSDHLDTPTVIADPAADIGDVYAWMSADGRRLHLVMDIVAHKFSDRLQYVLHIDSGKQFGQTTATITLVCRFDVANDVECWSGDIDYARGNASGGSGVDGIHGRMRVFAGLRDDPFFNNVKGTRAMYELARAAIDRGARIGPDGCPRFAGATSQSLLDAWRHTDGGPATNFLAGWKSSSLVISIDRDAVATGGNLLAVWGAVHKAPGAAERRQARRPDGTAARPILGEQIERTARPLIKNALVGGPLADASASNRRKEAYNRVARGQWTRFAADIQKTLGLYDGLDGRCGDQWLADQKANSSARYAPLAQLLADDRLWVNSAATTCTQFLAVELTALGAPGALRGDCGGRTPNYDANNIFRSLLVNGTMSGVDDGVRHDDKTHSVTTFPFLAAP